MVDESLKRLLDAEAKAEQVIAHADEERQKIIEQARHDVLALEQQHAKRVTDLRASFLEQAEQRAQQSIAELKRRHAERSAALRLSAQEREQHALDAAVNLILHDGPPT